MSMRKMDMRAEQELARFLDEHFYAELLKEQNFQSFERVSDVTVQKQGIDVIGSAKASCAYIDEKAQLHYINETRPTFAFELEFLLDGRAIEGWFLNEELKTTHYLLLWPNANTSDLRVLTSEDFTEVEGMILSKNKLKRYLEENGLDDDTLRQVTKKLRMQKVIGSQNTFHYGIKFYVSPAESYSENPVNLIISKKLLSTLADAHYVITQEGFKRIPTGS